MKKLLVLPILILTLAFFSSPTYAGIEGALPSPQPVAPEFNLPRPMVIPGSPVYVFKRWWENIRLTFSGDRSTRLQILSEISQERLSEVNALIDDGRSAETSSLLADYSQNKTEEVKILQDPTKVKAEIAQKALAANLTEDSILQVVKDELPNKIDQTMINKTTDYLENANESVIDQYDHDTSSHPYQSPTQGELPIPISNGITNSSTTPSTGSATPVSVPAAGSTNTASGSSTIVPVPGSGSTTSSTGSSTPVLTPLSTTSSTISNSENTSLTIGQVPPQLNSQPEISTPDLQSTSSAMPEVNASDNTPTESVTSGQQPISTEPAPPETAPTETVPADKLYSATDSATPADSQSVQGLSTKNSETSLLDQATSFFRSLFTK